MGGAVPPLPNTPSWRGAQLGGAQGDNLYITVNETVCECLGGLNFSVFISKHDNTNKMTLVRRIKRKNWKGEV
jgi:hypothetical protein